MSDRDDDVMQLLKVVSAEILKNNDARRHILKELRGRNPQRVPETELLSIIKEAAKIASKK